MNYPCDTVEQFVDGDLPPSQAEAFRLHLPDCTTCQHEVADLLHLEMLGERHLQGSPEQAPTGFPQRVPLARWLHPALLVGASVAITLGMVALVHSRAVSSPAEDPWLANRPRRLLEARLSYPGADHHRPPESRMAGNEAAHVPLPLQAMALIEENDPRGVAAAFLVRNDPGLANQALQRLEPLGHSPDAESDRAAALLLVRKPEEALRRVESALEQAPHHPQALWNRGLALRELGLPLLAAQAFSEVAALHESGWADEAAELAGTLRHDVSERRNRWQAVLAAGKALPTSSPRTLPAGFSQAPVARLFFYEAVRTATRREQVLELLPLAQELDKLADGPTLERYVQRVASADFSKRSPLSRDYTALVQRHLPGGDKGRLSSSDDERLLGALLESTEEDLLLGTLFQMHAVARLELFSAKAAASEDPWFLLLAAQERAQADTTAGRWSSALQTLLDAYRLCAGRGLDYRCIFLDRELSSISLRMNQPNAALKYAQRGWKLASDRNEWTLERDLLWNLAQISRYENDAPLARARYDELGLRDQDDLDLTRRLHQHRADIALHELDVDAARREIDAALATGLPLSFSGAFTLSDVSRLRGQPTDEAHLARALDSARPHLNPGEQAIATHVLGRFFIERDVARGRALLWRAIEEARARGMENDPSARKALAYSFTSLLFEAGRRNAFEEALELFGQQEKLELPRRCLLAATVDSERTLLIVRGATGEVVGHEDETRRSPLPSKLDRLVPERLLAPLRACSRVEVVARPPLHGKVGLLPPELAWSYRTSTTVLRLPQAVPPVHLVVHNVDLPPDSHLERLNRWPLAFGPHEQQMTLSGAAATPSRVLEAMRDVTEIDVVAHGLLNDSAQASYLLLAPEPGGPELGVPRVRSAELRGAPFVVLAACHAAQAGYSLHELLSLPAAFIQAGARGVLAATAEIPDLEAGAFFNTVRERMRAGASPAVALRDERLRWLSEGRGTGWLDSVLLFE